MKKLLLLLALTIGFSTLAQITEAGKWLGNNESKGNPYTLASDEHMELTLQSIEAYNAGEVEKELSYYTEEMANNTRDYMTKYHGELKKVTNEPWAMIPVQVKGSENVHMLVWSNETREWKNGSKQKLYLMEVFSFNKDKKINGFAQWKNFDPKNEFGLPSGGKFYGKKDTEYTGRKLVFSNRGEVETIEALIENYNKMDGKACQEVFAENAVYDSYDGQRIEMNESFFENYFESFESISWKAYGIVPLKIENTDPESGVLVTSIEKRVGKDGTVWEKELVEQYYFNLEGKIKYVEQWIRDIKK
ncbi:MAG: hypothetical protein ACO3HC_06810 [Flavobacteriaceae bacterium]